MKKPETLACLALISVLATSLSGCSIAQKSQEKSLQEFAVESARTHSEYPIIEINERRTLHVEDFQMNEVQKSIKTRQQFLQLLEQQGYPKQIRDWDPQVEILVSNPRMYRNKYICLDFETSNNKPAILRHQSKKGNKITEFLGPNLSNWKDSLFTGTMTHYPREGNPVQGVNDRNGNPSIAMIDYDYVETGISGLEYDNGKKFVQPTKAGGSVEFERLKIETKGGWDNPKQIDQETIGQSKEPKFTASGGTTNFTECWSTFSPIDIPFYNEGYGEYPSSWVPGAYSVNLEVNFADLDQIFTIPFVITDSDHD